jgi:hypothetical protein
MRAEVVKRIVADVVATGALVAPAIAPIFSDVPTDFSPSGFVATPVFVLLAYGLCAFTARSLLAQRRHSLWSFLRGAASIAVVSATLLAGPSCTLAAAVGLLSVGTAAAVFGGGLLYALVAGSTAAGLWWVIAASRGVPPIRAASSHV